ncbi:hypothetical protein ACTJJE_25470 [Mycolicibacterium sp. 22603]|uniref:hypothetical protein n=1 Tax=Mycolicibacterium sp. 22603 TaxID=3453950 RepID=UPI003F859783
MAVLIAGALTSTTDTGVSHPRVLGLPGATAEPTGPGGPTGPGPGNGSGGGSQFQPPGLPQGGPGYSGGNYPAPPQGNGIDINNPSAAPEYSQAPQYPQQSYPQRQPPVHGTQPPDYDLPPQQQPEPTQHVPQQAPHESSQQEPAQPSTESENSQDQALRNLQKHCEDIAQQLGITDPVMVLPASLPSGGVLSGPGRDVTGGIGACSICPPQQGPQTPTERPNEHDCTIQPGRGIQVANESLTNSSPPLNPREQSNDPQFGRTQLGGFERTIKGNAARAKAIAAEKFLVAQGWPDAAAVVGQYISNHGGGPSSTMARSLTFSEAAVDKLGSDPYNGGYGPTLRGVPDLLDAARKEALDAAKLAFEKCETTTFTEVFGDEKDWAGQPRGWLPVAGSDPNTVYGLGRYSAQIVTRVDLNDGAAASVQQRFYIFDVTDFAHPPEPGSIVSDPRNNAIDSLAFLRDIGWARAFNVYGASSIHK